MPDAVESDISLTINPEDILGREEYSETSAKKAHRNTKSSNNPSYKVSRFKPPKGSNEISVNRLNLSTDSDLAEIGMRNAALQKKKILGLVCTISKRHKSSRM